MTPTMQDMADTLIAMPDAEVANFMKSSLQARRLRNVVSQLNQQALSKDRLIASKAVKALRRLGFTD